MSVAWAKVNQCEDRYVEGNRAAWKALEDADSLVGSVIKSKISKTGCYLYIM